MSASCRGLAACAASLAALAMPAAAHGQAAPLPSDFVGMNVAKGDIVKSVDARRVRVLDDLVATRVQDVRVPFDWSLIEREPGKMDFTFTDALMKETAPRGLRVLPILEDPPDWRSKRPDGVERKIMYPPKSNAEMADFAVAVAARYGPGGTFWTSHPDLPPLPIVSWQVWNEPNIPVYWGQHPNAAEYTDMLQKVGSSIRAVQPGAEIVTAGLTYSPLGPPAPTFLEDMYRAGARGSFDTLAVHPYSRDDRTLMALIGDARAVLDAHGDGARIWVTEFGWATGDPSRPHFHTEAEQAELISNTVRRLGLMREQLRLRGFDYFYWAETAQDPAAQDTFWSHVGLLTYGDRRKPGYFAFRDMAAALLDGRLVPYPGAYVPDPVRIRKLKISPSRFAPARLAEVATRRRAHGSSGRRGGGRISFRADRTGTVLLTIEGKRHGRRARMGSARFAVYEGVNRVLLSGSVRRRALRAGRYLVRVSDAGGHGRPARAGFRIVKRRR